MNQAEHRHEGSASVHTNYIESDEEMALRLAVEWENSGAPGSMGDEECAISAKAV